MNDRDPIPQEWLERNPLLSADGWANLDRLLQHPDAPRWNFATGDRLVSGDLAIVDRFRQQLFDRGDDLPSVEPVPPKPMCDWVHWMRGRCWLFAEQIPEGFNLAENWDYVPTMSREDLASRIEVVVPFDVDDFSRFITYDTSGTTGHAVPLPYHPLTVAKHHALAELALARHGASPEFGPDVVACVNVCAQRNTYVFANVFSVWNDAAFAKVNLNEADWPGGRDAARRYLAELDPRLVTSDPISLAEMLEWEIEVRPEAILSTAVTLEPAFREELEAHYGCPVIDWYSTSETGPIAFSAPDADGYDLLPHDIYVEVVDEDGVRVEEGELGEITVTGGRNPYIPLLRYRTGDFGRMVRAPRPRLLSLEGREPVFFRDANGGLVNAVDIGRAMRLHEVFVQHQFTQHVDGSCVVRIRPASGVAVDEKRMARVLRELFAGREVDVVIDPRLGANGEKIVPYVTELER